MSPNRSQSHRSLLCSIEEDAGFIEALKLLHRRLDREVNPVTTSACDQLLAESLQRMELPDYEGSPDQREVGPGSGFAVTDPSQACPCELAGKRWQRARST